MIWMTTLPPWQRGDLVALNDSFFTASFRYITITDSTNGFFDTGIDSAVYVILGYYSTTTNTAIRISNLYSGGTGSNYRIQLINAVNGTVIKSTTGTYSVYLVYAKRTLFGF